MTIPQTTAAIEAGATNGVPGAFSADVVAFAAANEVEGCLQPLLEAAHRIFPTANRVKIAVEDDPELPDNTQIVFEVQVAGLSLDESQAARRQWHDALLSICPRSRVFTFCLLLDLE